MGNKQTELDRLQGIADSADYVDGIIDRKMHTRLFRIFSEYMGGGATLEIGPVEGMVTTLIAPKTQNLTLLEPTPSMADNLEKRFPRATVVRELIENWSPQNRFENIFMMHVLEHVVDAPRALARVAEWLEDGGRIFISVPNALSLHRQAGVEMGILEKTDSPSERDVMIGHRRIYTATTLKQDIESAGLSLVIEGGVFIKIASNAQIKQWNWSGELIDSLVAVGERYPEIASDIYAVAEKKRTPIS